MENITKSTMFFDEKIFWNDSFLCWFLRFDFFCYFFALIALRSSLRFFCWKRSIRLETVRFDSKLFDSTFVCIERSSFFFCAQSINIRRQPIICRSQQTWLLGAPFEKYAFVSSNHKENVEINREKNNKTVRKSQGNQAADRKLFAYAFISNQSTPHAVFARRW